LRLAVVIGSSVASDAEGRFPTGGELTLFDAVGQIWGLTCSCLVALRRSGMPGVN